MQTRSNASKNSLTPTRRQVLGVAAGALATPMLSPAIHAGGSRGSAVLVGSSNGLPGMQQHYQGLLDGAHPLDVAIEVVKVTEADPNDSSVGLGGIPNEAGDVALDAACMDGSTHNSGGVACIENILHPSEVARLVMERTDHCLLVGRGAYEFARGHGHPHTELLTPAARSVWMKWKESMSTRDDRLSPIEAGGDKYASLEVPERFERHGTIHCSALSAGGKIACTTTTSGLAFKIPGRIGDSPIIGAGLYCDLEAGSAGSTGRGEAAILSNGSFAIVELMRQGAHPKEAGLEVLRRIVRQVQRQASWQPSLINDQGEPAFGINFYIVDMKGRFAGVTMRGKRSFAVATPEEGPRLETLEPLL